MRFKALSIRQPWCEFVVVGSKTIELRSWHTHYRGDLLICSSARPDAQGIAESGIPAEDFDLGFACGRVMLVDVRPATRKDTKRAICVPNDGDYAWILESAEQFDRVDRRHRVPVKGKVGLFHVEIPGLTPREITPAQIKAKTREPRAPSHSF